MSVEPDLSSIVSAGWTFSNFDDSGSDLMLIAEELFKEAKAREESEPVLARSIRTIAHALFMQVQGDNADVPFVATWKMEGRRSAELSDFTEEEFKILEWALNHSGNLAIKARVSDILWIRKFGNARSHAVNALQCYVGSLNAEIVAGIKPDITALQTYQRALVIWNQQGQQAPERLQLEQVTAHLIDLQKTRLDCPYRSRFIEAALRGRIISNTVALEQFIESEAAAAAQNEDFDRQRRYLELIFLIARQKKDKLRGMSCRQEIGMTFVTQARAFRRMGMVAMALVHHYFTAIGELRKIGGQRNLIDELHEELLEFQPSTKDSFKELKSEVDVTTEVEAMLAELSKLSTLDALVEVSALIGPPKKEALRERAKKCIADAPLQHLFERSTVNDAGKVVHRKAGVDLGDPESIEKGINAETHQQLRYHVSLMSTFIEGARRELRSRCDVDESVFGHFVSANPFVDHTHHRSLIHGLWLGFNGDWIGSMSILIPQMEHAIRTVADRSGVVTSKLSDEFIQKERDLNDLLFDPSLEKVLGVDYQFLLQSILVSDAGYNFRNLIAHGLLSDDEIEGHCSPYIWALTIRLTYLFQRIYRSKLEEMASEKKDDV